MGLEPHVNNFSTGFFNDWFSDFDGMDIHAVLAACPCTDFASSGARHFAAKDADGRTVASVNLVHQTLRVIEHFKPAVWAVENPVGRIESLGGLPPWRLAFDPNHVGEDYTKKTLIWGRFNGDLPIAPTEATEGSKMHRLYGGKSMATKNARSATPEGFAYSFFMANNAHDHPAMAVANKFDRLDRGLIEQAIKAGVTPEEIENAVEDFYYMDLDDAAANEAIRDLLPEGPADGPGTGKDSLPAAPAIEAPKGWEKSYGAASKYAEALGLALRGADNKFKKLGALVAEITAATGKDGLQVAAAPAEIRQPQTLDALIGDVDAGYKVHYDYAGTDGTTLWIEPTDKGWVLKEQENGSATTFTKGGGAQGWDKLDALKRAEEKARYRFTEWKPVVEPAAEKVGDSVQDKIERAKRRLRDAKNELSKVSGGLGEASKKSAAAWRTKIDGIEREIRSLRQHAFDDEAPADEEMQAQEPWQMTQGAWFDHKWGQLTKKVQQSIQNGDKGFADEAEIRRQADGEHRRNVERAVQEDKAIPDQVLADYPDLTAKEAASVAVDDADLGALFDEVLAEETAVKPVTKPKLEAAKVKVKARAEKVVEGKETQLHRLKMERDSLFQKARNAAQDRHVAEIPGYEQRKSKAGIARLNALTNEEQQKRQGQIDETQKQIDRLAATTVAPTAAPTRSAGAATVSAAKNTAAGLADAIAGLGALFGGNGRLSSGLTFDEETYAKAKPLFKQAIAHFAAAGGDIKEAMRAVVRMILDQFGAAAATNMKPYVVRFMEDVKNGTIAYDEGKEINDGNDGRDGTGSAGADALGDAPAAEDGGPSGSGNAGVPGKSGGRTGAAGNRRSGGQGRGSAGGRGNGAAGVHHPAGRGDSGLDPAGAPATIPAQNFVITEDVRLGQGGEVAKFNDNLAAIRLLKALEAEKRRATADEQRVLARYVGWGGLANAFADKATGEFKKGWETRGPQLAGLLTKEELADARRSTMDAHYTAQPVVQAMWRAAERLGFRGGMVLEPSMGIGNFFGLVPAHLRGATKMIGVEYDSLTARMAKALYPQASVLAGGFQEVPLPGDSFDLAIGNPPFGGQSLYFPYNDKANGLSIHNQFFVGSMDAVRPGGLQIMVVSRYLMDAKDATARRVLGRQAELIGAIRLPDSAFQENARTEVVTDILFLRKHNAATLAYFNEHPEALNDATDPRYDWLRTEELADPLGGEAMTVNRYFAKNPGKVLGVLERSGSMRFGADVTVRAHEGQDLGAAIEAAVLSLPAGTPVADEVLAASVAQFEAMREGLELIMEGREEGAVYFDDNGALLQVTSREAPNGRDQLMRRPLSATAPWSPQLMLDAAGQWFRVAPKLDEAGNKVKKGRFVVYDREVFASEAAVPESLRLGETRFARLRDMVALRDLLKRQIVLETSDGNGIEDNRQALAKAYADFVATHGQVGAESNQALLAGMPDGPLVTALELSYDPGVSAAKAKKSGEQMRKPSAVPAPILKERVMLPYVAPEKAESAHDALFISLAERGGVDLERMAQLLGSDEASVIQALHADMAQPLIFNDPETGRWETRDAYLSGPVIKKLNAARAAGLDRHVEALEAVQPEPIAASEIGVRIGSVWVPGDIYGEFVGQITGEPGRVQFVKAVNLFDVSGNGQTAKAKIEFGTARMNALDILDDLLNSRAVTVYDTYTDENGKPKRVLNEEATAEAQTKAEEINNLFADWIMADADRRQRLAMIYNEQFNNRVLRQYDGSLLTLPGKVPDSIIKLRRHQMNAVWRGIVERSTLFDHCVGAGKAQPLDAKVLTPAGWKLMGDIAVGDLVIAGDGSPTVVEAVFPQGEKDIYRVVFSDGSATECCDEHLWLTQTYRQRMSVHDARCGGYSTRKGSPVVRSLAEIRASLHERHYIPVVGAIEFSSQPIPLDPYMLGALIGDGCFRGDSVQFAANDPETVEKFSLPDGVEIKPYAAKGRCPVYWLTANQVKPNPVNDALRKLGLWGLGSRTKFVPAAYLFNSPAVRLAVLQGLMDTDGGMTGRSARFTSYSKQLAEDVVDMVRSLGGIARMHNRRGADGEMSKFTVGVTLPAGMVPFRLSRKANAYREYHENKTKVQEPLHSVVSVESVGQKPAQCIRVAHPSHLYVTDDFIVTHNTFTAIARNMERRRMGLSRKPLVVVPNHMVEQFATDVYRLYPGARVLAAGKKDFEAKKRRRLFARIATGDWDMVIVPHSSFGFIGISPEKEAAFIEKDLAELEAAVKEAEALDDEGGRFKPQSVKEGERQLEAMRERLKKINSQARDKLLTFEQLGVDDLTVDEAHEFKNLRYYTRLTKVLGLGNKQGSKKANDLYNKVRVLRESPNGSVTFMTGTPISNSVVEMYTMMRYLGMSELEEAGLEHFDAWSKQFAEAVTKFELNDANQLAEKTRLSRWSNMPELMKLYYNFTDAVSLADIQRWYREDNGGKEFPVPKIKGGKRRNVIVEPSPAQQAILDEVVGDFNGLKEIKDPRERNKQRLRLMDRARKVSLDARAVDPTLPTTEAGGKLETVAGEVARIWREWADDKGTQLIFLDRSVPKAKGDDQRIAAYDKLKAEASAALAANDEAAFLEVQDKLDKIDGAEIEAMRAAQTGGWNAYEQIKQNLIGLGIPAKEIRFIQEAATDDQKQQIFDAVKAGEVRVLLGSTQRMGAGTNVQDRMVALHHVDVNWKPSDIEQREGRGIRQGNLLLEKYGIDEFEFEIVAYATERTYDAKMWALNEAKGRFINGLRAYDGEREVEIDDEESENMAEMAAMASGDPRMLERVQIDAEVKKLEMMRRSHNRRQYAVEDAIKEAERDIEQLPGRIVAARADHALMIDAEAAATEAQAARRVEIEGEEFSTLFEAHKKAQELIAEAKGDNTRARFSLQVDGQAMTSVEAVEKAIDEALGDATPLPLVLTDGTVPTSRKTAAALINAEIAKLSGKREADVGLGMFHGLPLSLYIGRSRWSDKTTATLYVKGQYVSESVEAGEIEDDGRVSASALREALGKLGRNLAGGAGVGYLQHRLSKAEAEIGTLREQGGKPFPKQDEYEAKLLRLEQLTDELAAEADSGQAVAKAAPADDDAGLAAFSKPRRGGYAAEDFRAAIDASPTAEVARDVEFLQQQIETVARRAGLSTAGARIEAATVPDAAGGLVAAIKRLFGVDVRFVSAGGLPADLAFDGIYVGRNTLYVNADSGTAFSAVIGHEFLHYLRHAAPDLYQNFITLAAKALRLGAAGKAAAGEAETYRRFGIGEADATAMGWEEIYADMFADAWADPAFWEALAGQDRSLTQKVLQALRQFLNRIRAMLMGERHSPLRAGLYRDFDAVRAVVLDATKQFAEGGYTPYQGLATTRFVTATPGGAGPEGGRKASGDEEAVDDDPFALDFAHDVLTELSFEDKLFRYAPSKAKTLAGNILDAMPGAEYLGEDTRADERAESLADRRFVFATPKETIFYVYTKGNEVWIDVSRLRPGDQGGAIYHGVANYAHNAGKVFVGDPMGLSDDAIIRRTSAMLSSALRFGTTSHFQPANEQIKGAPDKGIEPLVWRGNDVEKTKSLIDNYVKTLQNLFPSIENYHYDFGSREFRDHTGRRVGGERLEQGASGRYGRASRAGEASLRRGIFLQSLVSSESGERPGLLEEFLRRPVQFVEEGGLGAVFSRRPVAVEADTAQAELDFKATAAVYGGRETWALAKAAGTTRLGYRQWVQVRTPKFKAWFGDWEAQRAEQRLDAMAPVEIAVPEAWQDLPVAELRQKVRDVLLAAAEAGDVLQHPEIGAVELTRRGIGKALSASADPAKLLVIGDLRRVLEQSIFASATPVGADKPGIVSYEKLLAKIRIGGHDLATVFSIERRRDGRQFYNAVTLEDMGETTPAASPRDTPGRIAGERASSANTGVDSFIRRPIARVNAGSVSKVVDAETGEPLVVYHGTAKDFPEFASDRANYFTASQSAAGYYAEGFGADRSGLVMPVYLSIKNPKILPLADSAKLTKADIDRYSAEGFDGVFGTQSEYMWGDKPSFLIMPDGRRVTEAIPFSPAKIKSTIGNNGNFDPAEGSVLLKRSVPEMAKEARQYLNDTFAGDTAKTFNWWHKTVGSQFHKAKIDPHFGRVFNGAQQFIEDVARYGTEAADLAPDLLPKMDTMASAAREFWNARRDNKDAQAIAKPIFDGTLFEDADGNKGMVWSDDELRTMFNLDERQIGLYRQFRRAVDHSLEVMAIAEMNKAARVNELELPKFGLDMDELAEFYAAQYADRLDELRAKYERRPKEYQAERQQLLANAGRLKLTDREYRQALDELQSKQELEHVTMLREIEDLERLDQAFRDKAATIRKLQREGYAPLMRFGKFTVDVVQMVPAVDEAGQNIVDPESGEMQMAEERLFFSMFESEREAREAERIMAEEYPQAKVSRGVASEDGYQLFGGINPGSLEALIELVGKEDEIVQRFYKEAVANRSALKRLIHRKGTAGYSQDVSRSLASFLMSNARATASADHFGDMIQAAADIPKHKGDVTDEAVKLINYIRNPNEEVGTLRGLLFMQFLGGSIAAAAVNLTQTVTTTLPYMHQFGGTPGELAKAGTLAAQRMRGKATRMDPDLATALTRAEDEGVVAPHNIHALMGATGGQMLTQNRFLRMASHAWGSFFGMAEQFNRETVFIAAFNRAMVLGAEGLRGEYQRLSNLNAGRGLPPPAWGDFASPYAFAKNAVNETQFVLSKAARPKWARGAVGATLFTFKQFSVMYLELFKRLPNKERAIMLGILVVLSGIGGLPGADDLDDLIDSLGQMAGYNTNARRWKDRAAVEVFGGGEFGRVAGDFVTTGVSAFLPLELSTRLGMGNLLPMTGALKRSNSGHHEREIMEVMGPAGGYFKQLTDAWDYTLQGRYGMAMAQGFAPKALKDLSKGIDMAASGSYDDTHGRRVTEVSPLDALVKAIGFQPSSVAGVQRVKGEEMQDIALAKLVKASIAETWASGIHDHDAAKSAEAREMLAEWNRKNPESPIAIKPASVLQRVRQMQMTAAQRMVKTAPKEMRAGVRAAFAE